MRTQAICLALAIVLSSAIASAQWVQQNSETTRNLYSVYFTDANTGTAVGDSGTILRTTNGGAIWKSQSSGTFRSLAGVSFTDANTGTVVGDSGTILRTTNGGATWMPQSSGSTLSLCGVCFTDATNGTVVGGWDPMDRGLILHTTNGGVIWTKQFETDSGGLRSVSFSDGNTGTVVGGYSDDPASGRAIILRTTDGGSTWKSQTGTQGGFVSGILNSVSFTDSNMGTAVGGFHISGDMGYSWYLILRTTDGGATWTVQKKVTPSGGFNSVFFADADTGTMVGSLVLSSDEPRFDNILRTIDGGATWTPQPSGTTNVLWGVYFTDANTGTVVGSGGTILHTANGGVSSVEGEQHEGLQECLLSQNYPNPFNPGTTIKYELPRSSMVRLSVYDILGSEVSVLVNERRDAGVHEVRFDATGLSSGVYIYKMKAGEFVQAKKLLLIH